MRIAMTLALVMLPLAAWSQWGDDKQTFDARFGMRHVEANFTVANNGFGWQRAFTDSQTTFNAWSDVTAWCSAPGTVLVRTRQSPSHHDFYDLTPEDLVTIVDGYFKKHVPELEWSSPGWECTMANLSRPNPADLAKVRELLEAASGEKP